MKGGVFLYTLVGCVFLAALAGSGCGRKVTGPERDLPRDAERPAPSPSSADGITIFLSGDVMTGRGIDQVLPHPGDPRIHEPYLQDARDYVKLAENAHGPVTQPVDYAYIWGDALEEWERVQPDVRIINLETSITASDDYWEGKGIHYRMNPQNVPCLTAARIDCCTLANNHVLDWGYRGLTETLDTLQRAHIQATGAGQNLPEAEAPAILEVQGKGRVLVFAYGLPTSGIADSWGAAADRAGVNLLPDLSKAAVRRVKERIAAVARPGDIVVVSLHWGGNWGYAIPREQMAFAHQLIDDAGVDIVHGHSSHHVKGIEVYQGRPIFYGCGDLLNDYEGIGGYENFRGDLALLYFVAADPATGRLVGLQMRPMQIRHLKLNRASRADTLWLQDTLNREGKPLGTRVEMDEDGMLTLRWY